MSFTSNTDAFVARVAAMELAMHDTNVLANPILVAQNVANTAKLLAQATQQPAHSPLRQVLTPGMTRLRAPAMTRSFAMMGFGDQFAPSSVCMVGIRAPMMTRSYATIGTFVPEFVESQGSAQIFLGPQEESQTRALNPTAPEFVPITLRSTSTKAQELNPTAPEFVPTTLKVISTKMPELNPAAPEFVLRPDTAKVFKLGPLTPEFVPRRGAANVSKLNPAALEFIPPQLKNFEFDLATLEFVLRKLHTVPRPRKVVPIITDEMWDCVEFMDLLESCDSFEELEAPRQPDDFISGLSPLAPEFVPRWTHTSAESQSQDSEEELCAIPMSRSYATIGTREIESWANSVSEECCAVPTSGSYATFGNGGLNLPRSPLTPYSPVMSECGSMRGWWDPDDYIASPVSEFEFSPFPRFQFEDYDSSSEPEWSVQSDNGSLVSVPELTHETARFKLGFWVQTMVALLAMLLLLGGLGNY